MITNETKLLLTRATIIFVLLVTFFACQDDIDEQPQQIQPRTYQFSLDDMPELHDVLAPYLGPVKRNLDNSPQASSGEANKDLVSRIDFEYILARMDTSGQTYMSMSIANEDPKVIQNLVVGKDINQNLLTPMIFTYAMSEEFYQTFLETGSLEGFSGSFRRENLQPYAIEQNNSMANISNYGYSTSTNCPDETNVNTRNDESNDSQGNPTSNTDYSPTGTSSNTDCTYTMIFVEECTETWKFSAGDYSSSSCREFDTVTRWVMTCPDAPNQLESSDSNCDNPNDGEVPVVPHVILDPTFTTIEKLMCIWSKLKGIKGMQVQLRNFDSEMSIYNLKIEVKPFDFYDGYNRNGATRSYEGNNEVNILLNENRLNRPVLDIARTIYHEAIHAEMYRKVREHGNIDNVNENDYPGIYDYYRRYIKGWQHELMAQHYVDRIANLLKTFDGGFEDDSVYTALAWVGLKGYQDNEGNFIEYTAWTNLTPIQKEEYKNLKNEFMKRGSLLCD